MMPATSNSSPVRVITGTPRSTPPRPAPEEAAEQKAAADQARIARINLMFDGIGEIYAGVGRFFDVKSAKENALAQARLEDRLGYRPQVNAASLSLYNAAKADRLGAWGVSSDKDALKYATRTLSRLESITGWINRLGQGDPKVGGTWKDLYSEEHMASNPSARVRNESLKDLLEANRMELVAETKVLAKTFGIKEPLYEVRDGSLRINAFDIFYGGKKIIRSLGDGKFAEYRPDGTLKLDQHA